MAAASSASSAMPSAASRRRGAASGAGAGAQLALDGGQHPGRDAGVELDPPLGGGHDVALEELAHRLDQLGRGRARRAAMPSGAAVVLADGDGSRRAPIRHSRSYSFSQTRRPMAASSTERLAPDR